MSDPDAIDLRWLDAAARLAMPALGTTGSSPTVGAIVADRTNPPLLGRGVTTLRGNGQAELLALAEAREAAAGCTLYMTLEPPASSSAAIAEAGIARVVVGALDPDPLLAGEGLKALTARNVGTHTVAHEPSRRLNEGYAMRLTRKRPFVTMKVTVSVDGMVGHTQPGNPPPMGIEALRFVDRERAASDAVLSGVARAEVEDNDLRIRLPGLDERAPLRVALVGAREFDQTMQLFAGNSSVPMIVFTTPEHPVKLRRGIDVVQVEGRRSHPDLRKVTSLLAIGGINRLFVEAGARLAESFIAAELIDRLHVIDSALNIGRFGVPAALGGRFHERVLAAKYTEVDRLVLGEDKVRTYERR